MEALSIRFPIDAQREGFAVRGRDGEWRAYVNVCPHRLQPVDVGDGKLFNARGEIECGAHGARFDPDTGACVGGPCEGSALSPLPIEVRGGQVRPKPDSQE